MFCDDDEDVMSRRCEDVVETKKYTQTRLHTNNLGKKPFYTQALLHKDLVKDTYFFTRRPLPIQTLAHTEALLHTGPFIPRLL